MKPSWFKSTPRRTRTVDLAVRSGALYPLSYEGMVCVREVGFEPTQAVHLLYRQARLSDRRRSHWGDRRELNPRLRSHNPALYH